MASCFRITFLFVSMCGVFRKHDDSLHSAEKDVGPDVHCFVRLTFATHNRLYSGSARNTCYLKPEPIINCVAASSSNTHGQHCRKMQQQRNKTNRNFQTDDLDRICTLHMWLLYAFQAKSASIDVTRGEGGVSPRKNFIYFVNISIETNNTKNTCFIVHKHLFKIKQYIFPGGFNCMVSICTTIKQ